MKRILVTCISVISTFGWAQEVTPVNGPPLQGTTQAIHDSPGAQGDPHVSGPWVVYTNHVGFSSEVRYHNLLTGGDFGVPTNGGLDDLPGISGTKLVYDHAVPSGITASIFLFDVAAQSGPTELDPQPNVYRLYPAIGGSTVAWQDFGFNSSRLLPEIVAYDLTTQTATRLTNDALFDSHPSVSPSGTVIVFTKCETTQSGCHIFGAQLSGGAWTTTQLTSGAREDSFPHTNGSIAIYGSVQNGEQDIYWQPVGGGPEAQLNFPGPDNNPHISGHWVAFEHYDANAATPNWDIYLYNLLTNTLYQLTNSSVNETLDDIDVDANGTARVVYEQFNAFGDKVFAFTFTAPEACLTNPLDACQNPGSRPLLASISVTHNSPWSGFSLKPFSATPTHDGLLCVTKDEKALGWIFVNGHLEVSPHTFAHSKTHIAKNVSLRTNDVLLGLAEGKPRTGFTASIYGADPNCVPTDGQDGGSGSGSDDKDCDKDDRSSPQRLTAAPNTAGPTQTLLGIRANAVENGTWVIDTDEAASQQGRVANSSCAQGGGGLTSLLGFGLSWIFWLLRRRTLAAAKARQRR